MYRPSFRSFLPAFVAACLLAGCGNGDTPGEGFVTVQGLSTAQAQICGQVGGQPGSGTTLNVLGSGFLSEHGVDVLVTFNAQNGTPFDSGTSATATVDGTVITDTLIVVGVPDFQGTATVTLTVVLPGQNQGTSVPGQLSIGGFLDGPYAFADFYVTPIDQTLTVPVAQSVLVNDFGRQCIPDRGEPGPGNIPVSVSGFTIESYDTTTPNGGTVVMAPDGSFVYTPASGFEGQDQFAYTMNDNGFTASSTVFIFVDTGSTTAKPSAR